MTYDRVFKSVMQDKECREYLVDIIGEIINIPKEEIAKNMVFKNTEQSVVEVTEKKKITDLIVELEDCVINIEMNKDYYNGIINKNYGYATKIRDGLLREGEEYSNVKKVIQINFDNYELYDERIVIKFEMMDEERNTKEGVDYESYHINLKKVKEKYYNKEELSGFEKELLVMTLKDEEELKELSKENKKLEKVTKKIKNVSLEEELQGWYDKEEQERYIRNSIRSTSIKEGIEEGLKEGLKEGIKENQIMVAKRMLEKKIEIEIVCEVTGLSTDELDKISKN